MNTGGGISSRLISEPGNGDKHGFLDGVDFCGSLKSALLRLSKSLGVVDFTRKPMSQFE